MYEVIAERRFDVTLPNEPPGTVTIKITRPYPSITTPGLWQCDVTVEGAGIEFGSSPSGVDSLGALGMAASCIVDLGRYLRKKTGNQVMWHGGDWLLPDWGEPQPDQDDHAPKERA